MKWIEILEWLCILFAPFVLVGYFLQNSQQIILHNYGLISYWLLAFILIVPLLMRVPYLGFLSYTRKLLGLLAFYFAAVHSYFYWINHSMPDHLFNPNWTLFFGLLGMIFMTVLACTSHETIKKVMGAWWFRLHKLIYVIFIFVTLHIVLLANNAYAYWVVLIICSMRFIYSYIFKKISTT